MDLKQSAEDFQKIEKAIQFLEANVQNQPELAAVAAAVNVSEFHFQRIFSRWIGISPKRFLQYLTKEYAKSLLHESQNLLDTTFDSGFSSPSRLHDLFVSCEAVTPGEFKNKGEGLTIRYGIHPSPFGQCLLAFTERGICNLMFLPEDHPRDAVAELKSHWQNATIAYDQAGAELLIQRVFGETNQSLDKPLHLVLKGTNFQIKVWEALLTIPSGMVLSYEDIARQIGNPRAVRAVASAVANNPIAFLIPCHRVIRKMGIIHKYRWGAARKKAIIGWEAAQREVEIESRQ